MDTELKVDLDKRTATLVLDYFTATVEDPKEKGELITNLSQVENLVLSVKGNKIDVGILYDFGVHIPESIWKMRDSSFIDGWGDKSLSQYWDQLCKEAILESVKQLLPTVMRTLREKAKEFVKG